MKKMVRGTWQNFWRGAGSVIDLLPRTRNGGPAKRISFERTVFINGKAHRLGAKQHVADEANKALGADWRKITGDLVRSAAKLSPLICAHAKR